MVLFLLLIIFTLLLKERVRKREKKKKHKLKQKKKFYWGQAMELLKKMKYELETFCSTRINKVRLFHDF